MPTIRPLPAAARYPVSAAELAVACVDVYKEALKHFSKCVTARLTGPDAEPVFIPQINPCGQNYRGLVLTPPGWRKTAQKA